MRKLWYLLRPYERIALIWCLFTLVLMACMCKTLVNPEAMLIMRLEWLGATALAVALSAIWKHPVTELVRVGVQLGWLSLWYPDTYDFNRTFTNLDHIFASAEYTLFGCQPSIAFSETVTNHFWSEAFCLGYGSYFFLMAALCLVVFFQKDKKSQAKGPNTEALNEVVSIIMCAFCLFYLIFIFVPVAGPQFYFPVIGLDQARAGIYPAIGSYFSGHYELMPCPGWSEGFFRHTIDLCHQAGERPTAAFPSSHVGIGTIVMILAFQRAPKLGFIIFPIYLLLVGSTVYIMAHYVIDAAAGFFIAPILFGISTWVTHRLSYHPGDCQSE